MCPKGCMHLYFKLALDVMMLLMNLLLSMGYNLRIIRELEFTYEELTELEFYSVLILY